MKILVSAASRHGATSEIAKAIAMHPTGWWPVDSSHEGREVGWD